MNSKKIKLYAGLRKSKDNIEIKGKPIHIFKNEKEFEETSGIYALTFFMKHPLENLMFCYCYENEDITKDGKECSYGFMEDEEG